MTEPKKLAYDAEKRIMQMREAADVYSQMEMEELLWNALLALEGHSFQTAKGLHFSYSIRGNEIFFSRKEKSVTRATANMAMNHALQLQREGQYIKGPKMLRCFGASYLYPVFIRIGIIDDAEPISLKKAEKAQKM